MSGLKALIFDVDGTLAETERDAHRVGFNQAFEEAGLTDRWDPDLYGELLAVPGGKERIRHYWTARKGEPEPDWEWVKGLHERKAEVYTERIRAGLVPPRSGIMRLLREAREAGVRLAIATTTTRAPLMELLAHTLSPEAADWFEVIVAGDEVAAKKPSPDAYDKALADLGLSATECLAVEDSPPGVESAVAAGIPVVVTTSEYTQNREFPGALAVYDRLGEPDSEPARLLFGGAPLPGHGAVDLAYLRDLFADRVTNRETEA
ncbi:HAD-IA family hydrolase [Thiohalorhabdus methylotrophus]|uniref:HAD-IA family hydrolase n=1 Tax=Thiohalorhabdus methylotrophus TaxID=3242694 RepID=A0ABV4TVE0_9GAMM